MSGRKLFSDFARPFRLLPPALGLLSGAITAWGAEHHKLPLALPPRRSVA